jgi:hypothetical protein
MTFTALSVRQELGYCHSFFSIVGPLAVISAWRTYAVEWLSGQDFSILTAYELSNGRVLPLEGHDAKGETVVSSFAAFEGIEENAFMKFVEETSQTSQRILWRKSSLNECAPPLSISHPRRCLINPLPDNFYSPDCDYSQRLHKSSDSRGKHLVVA